MRAWASVQPRQGPPCGVALLRRVSSATPTTELVQVRDIAQNVPNRRPCVQFCRLEDEPLQKSGQTEADEAGC